MQKPDIAYKLTESGGLTRNYLKWEIGRAHFVTRPSKKLCSDGVLHAYRTPEMAVLLNPIHARFTSPRLFEIECEIVADDGLKVGCWWQKPIRELPLPKYSLAQRVAFGILAASAVFKDPVFMKWADNWLNGRDRSRETANHTRCCASHNFFRGSDDFYAALHAAAYAARAAVSYAGYEAGAVESAEYVARAAECAARARQGYPMAHFSRENLNVARLAVEALEVK